MKEEINIWAETIVAVMTTFWSKVAGIIPNLVAAIVIMVIGYFIARFIGFVLARILKKIGFDGLSKKVGIADTLQKAGIKLEASAIVGALGFWIILLMFLVTATESLGLPRVSGTIDAVVLYLPKVIAAAIIVVVGLFLARFVRDIVRTGAEGLAVSYAKPLGNAAYVILFVVIISLAINELEIETELLDTVFSILIAAIAIAIALSLGLGTRDLSSNLVAGYYARDLFAPGAQVTLDACEGKIEIVGPVKTTIKCKDGSLMTVANSELVASSVQINTGKASAKK